MLCCGGRLVRGPQLQESDAYHLQSSLKHPGTKDVGSELGGPARLMQGERETERGGGWEVGGGRERERDTHSHCVCIFACASHL